MLVKENQVIFSFPELLKTSRIGHSYSLNLDHYRDEKLCPMHTLLYYIDKTLKFRLSRKVLVSYVTYKEVSTSTIARWLKNILDLSGINTETFKAHSYRSASVSAAFSRGCSLKNILDTADWSSDKTFKKFYCRHSVRKENISYANAVFHK
ncbi:MAG: hypothetical protein AB2693_34430 [Candidatus Thiodiazotropha sp.]